jgi:hypothetical protein
MVAAFLDWHPVLVIAINAFAMVPLGVDLYFLRDEIAKSLSKNRSGVLFVLSNNIETLLVSTFPCY